MNDTPNLALPYILAAQAQKHVTHNEALRALDCLLHLAVLSRGLWSPPASPAEGARYIVAASATGAWIGQTAKVAAFQDGVWAFYAPKNGWRAWVEDEAIAAVYDGSAWVNEAGAETIANSQLADMPANTLPTGNRPSRCLWRVRPWPQEGPRARPGCDGWHDENPARGRDVGGRASERGARRRQRDCR